MGVVVHFYLVFFLKVSRFALTLFGCVLVVGCFVGAAEHDFNGEVSAADLFGDTVELDGDSQPERADSGVALESVTISGVTYQVPPPWLGRRIGVDDSQRPDKLVMIPRELAHEQTAIYVTPQTRDAFMLMADAAREDGVELLIDSGYRSVRYQRIIFDRLLQQGREFSDIVRFVAPPGYSEHMFGDTLDFVPSNYLFYDSDSYRWLVQHGGRFGFVQSLPRNSPDGLPWEAWHWRHESNPRQ